MKNNNKLITVIVPVYNCEKTLDRCLNSITCQGYSNLEILLIDDGSKDKSVEICDAWAQKDKRIKVVHKKNGGVSSARNEGLKLATGEYVSFVDSDDEISPDFYGEMLGMIEEKCGDVCVCAYKMRNLNLQEKIVRLNLPSGVCSFADLSQSELINQVWTKLWKKKCVTSLFDEKMKFGEDNAFVLQNIGDDSKICYVDKPLYVYYEYESSLSNNFNVKMIDDFVLLLEIWLKRFGKLDKQICYNALYKKLVSFIYLISIKSTIKIREMAKILRDLTANQTVKNVIRLGKSQGVIQRAFKVLLKLKMYKTIIFFARRRKRAKENHVNCVTKAQENGNL